MRLRDRAALALDITHRPDLAYRGPMTMKLRWLLACWLDGKKTRVGIVRRAVAYLEMVARTAQT